MSEQELVERYWDGERWVGFGNVDEWRKLGEWLTHMRKVNEESVAKDDPAIKGLRADLQRWEDMVGLEVLWRKPA